MTDEQIDKVGYHVTWKSTSPRHPADSDCRQSLAPALSIVSVYRKMWLAWLPFSAAKMASGSMDRSSRSEVALTFRKQQFELRLTIISCEEVESWKEGQLSRR